MGILSRKAAPPTALALGDACQPATQQFDDLEKAATNVQDPDSIMAEQTHAVDPEVERRVLRKIDWHLPPLVAFLCEPASFLPRPPIVDATTAMTWDVYSAKRGPS